MIGDVKARIVRSDGQELTLGDGEWRIPNNGLDNWANLPYSVSSVEVPSYDGAVVTSKRVASVDRSIIAEVYDTRDSERLRYEAIAFFNPKYSFEVHLTYMGRTRWCAGEQIGFKCSEHNIYERVRIEWTILCANPFLQSESDFGKDIAEVIPRLSFPFMSFLPVSEGSAEGCNVGFIASVRSFGQSVTLKNDGDVPSGMRVRIKANQRVLNPMLKIGDGFVRAIKLMEQGDVLELDLSGRPPKVTYNGENAMHLLDRNSSILDMVISPGDTVIEYDADDGEQFMSVSVYYNKQYLGI